MARTYLDSSGARISLSGEIGRGGEGAVFEIAGRSNVVAKIYHRPPDQNKADKVRAMAHAKTPGLISLTAWPTEVLVERGSVAGIVMPRIDGYKDLHKLYGPKSRLHEFENAAWDFLVHTAANVARAFALVHESGHVIGDVNHGNVVAAKDGTVRLIDCDSFQVTYRGRVFSCDVGVLTHQPPELQGVTSFRGVPRTQNHDNFGLAVLIFQLLFMARHPFSGRFHGTGDMPIERAIREFRFAYGADAGSLKMSPPPGALTLGAMHQQVGLLFERAFSSTGQNQRPRPSEWAAALDAMKATLRRCSANPGHSYVGQLSSCPICAIERAAGVILFLPPLSHFAGNTGSFNLASVWAKIVSVSRPGPIPQVSVPHIPPTRKPRPLSPPTLVAAIIALSSVAAVMTGIVSGAPAFWTILIGCVIGVAVFNKGRSERDGLRRELRRTHDRARSEYDALERRMRSECDASEFDKKLQELTQTKASYQGLPEQRRKELARLEANKRALQLEQFLDQFEIEKAKISGVGPGKKATLESHGIETAADVSHGRIINVPGFGEKTALKLIAWRQKLETKFIFDPTKAIDRAAMAAVERDIVAARLKLEAKLNAGAAELARIQQTIIARRSVLVPRLQEAAAELAQADAALRSG